MNNMKRQKDMILEDETPRSEDVQYLAGKEWRAITNSSKKKKKLGQSRNVAQWWICLVVNIKSNAVNNNIA